MLKSGGGPCDFLVSAQVLLFLTLGLWTLDLGLPIFQLKLFQFLAIYIFFEGILANDADTIFKSFC